MMESLVPWVLEWAGKLPVVWFSFLGSLAEEIISPIPSPLVMTTVGSALAARESVGWYVFVLVILLATIGKTIGYWIVYVLADKVENVVLGRFGNKIGVSHAKIESIGKMFSGTWRDDFFVFLVRFLPVMPSAPITVTAGVIKLPLVRFLTASFAGTLLRNIMYLSVGYLGVEAFRGIIAGYKGVEVFVQIAVGLFLISIIVWAFRQRSKGRWGGGTSTEQA